MLSSQSTEVIRTTLPVVGAAIGDITSRFYERMLTAHPELERDLFNRANQKQGEQQKALAGAIAAFATLQLEPDQDKVDLILSRIAHKHASLGITPDQYAIVHEHLFAAIVEILGEAVTPEVAAAWNEVYWLMAETLISMERDLYELAGVESGDVWRTVRITERVLQSADTVSLTLASTDGGEIPTFAPGQYLSVGVVLADGARQIRQYSLCSTPSSSDWRITVKRISGEFDGEVSNFLYSNVFEGDTLSVTTPFGDLTMPDDDSPLLLASAGIGCTPMIGMLNHLVDTGATRSVCVIHADRSIADHAHRTELSALVDKIPAARLHRWYEDLGVHSSLEAVSEGRADLRDIELDPDTQAFLCGPMPFMLSMRESLIARDIPAQNIHYEVFGPDSWANA
ncbi:globin domain-containing protein [Rhodococcus sp. IEGM 1379]|uniref:globin domain-containing protein n=1 Tax=Rhodococcus sp. IEGM 1379 TaxID=3047086 RepID=UPI0024B6DB23|nr:globin domain-containing protein [Rhodococcus sp. IEGM 1379]MDI9913915.1 globin domain-containing protein [Rhodococcus sp. IEGM 1379]